LNAASLVVRYRLVAGWLVGWQAAILEEDSRTHSGVSLSVCVSSKTTIELYYFNQVSYGAAAAAWLVGAGFSAQLDIVQQYGYVSTAITTRLRTSIDLTVTDSCV